jgi:hypothetical protein
MTARTLISDSGSVVRLTKRWLASDSGSVVRLAKRVFVSDSGGVARLIFANQVTATASPSTCMASGFGPITLTTNTTTVTAVGGIPPYTYLWTLSGASGPTITITNPTGATTAFTAHVGAGATAVAAATCTVTDSIGDIGQASVGVIITTTN